MSATDLNLDVSKELNVTVRRGDTLSFEIAVSDSDGDAVDLTAYTFDMDIRSRRSVSSSSRTDIVLSNTVGGRNRLLLSITGSADGTLSISASREAIASIPPGTYFYDIQANKSSDASTQTWFYGRFKVNSDLTVR